MPNHRTSTRVIRACRHLPWRQGVRSEPGNGGPAISRARSHTTPQLSAGSVAYGNENSITMKITVAPQFTATPTGKGEDHRGTGRRCAPCNCPAGTGTCSRHRRPCWASGKAALVASYPGDLGLPPAASAGATLTVRRATSRTTLTLSPASVKYGSTGDETSLKNTVAVAPHFSGTPAGNVVVTAGRGHAAHRPAGPARRTPSSPPSAAGAQPGRHALSCVRPGRRPSFAPSSAAKTLTVTKP